MADMHTTDGTKGGRINVVMHFDVPPSMNKMGVSYQTALKNSRLKSVSILQDGDGNLGTISPAEKQKLADGELFEHVESTQLDGKGQNSVRRDSLMRKEYARKQREVIGNLKARLDFFGKNLGKV